MKLGFIFLGVSGLLWLVNLHLTLPGVNFLRSKLYSLTVSQPLNQSAAETATLTAQIFSLSQENARLRDLLGAPLSPGWQFLPAPVVKLDGEIMSLAVGHLSGVKQGQMVIAYQKENINNGVVLGQVSRVYGRQSEVKLLFSRELSVKAVTNSGASGIVTGDGQVAWLNQVVQADRLTEGDLILTAGGDGWLSGLVLGRVGEIVLDQAAIYQQAKIKWVVDPGSVVNAYIIHD